MKMPITTKERMEDIRSQKSGEIFGSCFWLD